MQILGYFLPVTVAKLIARGTARLRYYFISNRGATNHLKNLKKIYGDSKDEKELKEISKKAFYSFAINLYEHIIMGRLNKRNYKNFIKGENIDNLYSEYSKGRGVIILSGHIGNYEWGASLMSFHGFPVSVISIEYMSDYIKYIYEKNRKKVGVSVFYIKKSFTGPVRFLKKGGVLAIAGDRNFSDNPIQINIFNNPVKIPRGAFFLASKFKIPVVPAFSVKEKDGLYHVYFEKGFTVPEDNIEEATSRYSRCLEKYIKHYPEQWHIFDRLWE